MNQKDINDLYEKIGIGSEEERDRFTKWDDTPISNNYYFIISCPSSAEVDEEGTNA